MERKIIYLDDAIDALRYAQHRFTVADEACFATLCSWLKCDAKEEEVGAEIYKI